SSLTPSSRVDHFPVIVGEDAPLAPRYPVAATNNRPFFRRFFRRDSTFTDLVRGRCRGPARWQGPCATRLSYLSGDVPMMRFVATGNFCLMLVLCQFGCSSFF